MAMYGIKSLRNSEYKSLGAQGNGVNNVWHVQESLLCLQHASLGTQNRLSTDVSTGCLQDLLKRTPSSCQHNHKAKILA